MFENYFQKEFSQCNKEEVSKEILEICRKIKKFLIELELIFP